MSRNSVCWTNQDMQGLAVLGHRVMETVGRDITDINFSRGFAIELGSTLSVVLASVVGESSLVLQCRHNRTLL